MIIFVTFRDNMPQRAPPQSPGPHLNLSEYLNCDLRICIIKSHFKRDSSLNGSPFRNQRSSRVGQSPNGAESPKR